MKTYIRANEQYNGYNIQYTSDNEAIVRDSKGNFIGRFPSWEEAEDFIDDLISDINGCDKVMSNSSEEYDESFDDELVSYENEIYQKSQDMLDNYGGGYRVWFFNPDTAVDEIYEFPGSISEGTSKQIAQNLANKCGTNKISIEQVDILIPYYNAESGMTAHDGEPCWVSSVSDRQANDALREIEYQLKNVKVDDITGCDKITSSYNIADYYIDNDGSLTGASGSILSYEDLVNIWETNHLSDPVVSEFNTFEDWLNTTIRNGYISPQDKEDDIEASSDISDEGQAYVDGLDESTRDKIEDIADSYTSSVPVSGDWSTETEHELNTIKNELGISAIQAGWIMTYLLGFDSDEIDSIVNASTNIEASTSITSSYENPNQLPDYYTISSYIKDNWSAYDKAVAEAQLTNYGVILIDKATGEPVDDEYEQEEYLTSAVKIKTNEIINASKTITASAETIQTNIINAVSDFLNTTASDFWADLVDVKPYEGLPVHQVTISVDGDWKHDHIRFNNLFRENFNVFPKYEEKITSEDGSDSYQADHIFYLSDLGYDNAVEASSDISNEGQAYVDSLDQASQDKIWDIAEGYNTSVPVSGDWSTETEHELNTIKNELGISEKQAAWIMIYLLGFDPDEFESIINASTQTDIKANLSEEDYARGEEMMNSMLEDAANNISGEGDIIDIYENDNMQVVITFNNHAVDLDERIAKCEAALNDAFANTGWYYKFANSNGDNVLIFDELQTEDDMIAIIDSKDITATTYLDKNGMFGEPGYVFTEQEMKDFYDMSKDSDPVVSQYPDYESWIKDTKEMMEHNAFDGEEYYNLEDRYPAEETEEPPFDNASTTVSCATDDIHESENITAEIDITTKYTPEQIEYVFEAYDSYIKQFVRRHELADEGRYEELGELTKPNTLKTEYLVGAIEDELLTEEEFNEIWAEAERQSSDAANSFT